MVLSACNLALGGHVATGLFEHRCILRDIQFILELLHVAVAWHISCDVRLLLGWGSFRLNRASLVRQELEEVGVEAHSVFTLVSSLLSCAFFEENSEAREPIEALGAEVRLLRTCNKRVRVVVHTWG